MANLGIHYIYRFLRTQGIATERFFTHPIPFRSVEGDTLLERFQTILAAVSYETDILNLGKWLQAAGIPPSRRERGAQEGIIVGAGGAVSYINPLTLCGIADFIVLGDGLPVLKDIAAILKSTTERGQILSRLAVVPSVLVPEIHLGGGDVRLSPSYRLNMGEDYAASTWITPRGAFGSTLLLELQRGCAHRCAYCTLPHCFGPFRQRDIAEVERVIERTAERVSFQQIGLVTPEAGDYRQLERLLSFAADHFPDVGVSFASLRLDGLSDSLLAAISRSGHRSLTLAPETGNDALRKRAGKTFVNETVLSAVERAKAYGIVAVKLYFMIGLPGESNSDVESIADLCAAVKETTGVNVTATVSPFVPKAGTRWQNMDFDIDDLKEKHALLVKRAQRLGVGNLFYGTSIKEASLEYALSWSSSRLSAITAEKMGEGGFLKKILKEVDRSQVLDELKSIGLA